jgi:hypothetical protein
MKAVRKLSLEISTKEPRMAKRTKSIYSYLNKFSFFNDLLESKMKTIEPIDRIIFDNKIKLIVFEENKEF